MVRPLNLFRYFGGKYYLIDDIYQLAAHVPAKITIFVDAFGGSGTVAVNAPLYLRQLEVIVWNDISKALYKTMKVLLDDDRRRELFERLDYALRHYDIFMEYRKWYRETDGDDDTIDDVEVAFRVLYLATHSYASNFQQFGRRKNAEDDIGISVKNIQEAIRWLRGRLYIENDDFRNIIKRWDSPHTLFYLDPPYITAGDNYNHSFTEQDLADLAEILKGIKGYYILNESDKDFGVVTKYFGAPTMVKTYYNTLTNATRSGDYRQEGFWTNFADNVPKQVKLTDYFARRGDSDGKR